MVALIPARAGSKRIPGKNTKLLAGRPLIAHSITPALESQVFKRVIVCSDDEACWRIADTLGAEFFERNPVSDSQADIEWLVEVVNRAGPFDAFAILRPTSPLRTAETIHRAFRQFTAPDQTADSIRAVQPAREHPGKMWALNAGGVLTPLLEYKRSDNVPWHSCPTQTLPTFYLQNSSLEMAWAANIEVHGTIHGRKVAPFFTKDHEGLSLDYPEDWEYVERLVTTNPPTLRATHP